MAKGSKTVADPSSVTTHGTTKAPAGKGTSSATPAAPVKKGPKAK